MTKEEAQEIYINKIVMPTTLLYQNKILNCLDKNWIDITNSFIINFKTLCQQAKEAQKDTSNLKVGFIQYSFLYSSLRNEKFVYLAEIFDKDCYFGNTICQCNYNIEWLGEYLADLKKFLIKESKQYVQKINASDVEKFIFIEAKLYHEVIISMMKQCLLTILDLEELKELICDENIYILAGEYRGEFKKLYTINSSTEKIREKLYEIFFA